VVLMVCAAGPSMANSNSAAVWMDFLCDRSARGSCKFQKVPIGLYFDEFLLDNEVVR
jgi:hypothetical protein